MTSTPWLNEPAKLAQIGSYCTVFAATEVPDRIRAGQRTNMIVRGLFDSVAKRILEMDTLTGRNVRRNDEDCLDNVSDRSSPDS